MRGVTVNRERVSQCFPRDVAKTRIGCEPSPGRDWKAMLSGWSRWRPVGPDEPTMIIDATT
jgi:hypothetical protein